MMKKMLSLLLVVTFVQATSAAPAPRWRQSEDAAKSTEKVRAAVFKLGTGREARVRVELRDKTKLKGYVSQAGADSFTVTDAKTGKSTNVEYGQVARVSGHNMSTGTKIAIAVVVTVAVLGVVAIAIARSLSLGHVGAF